MTLLLRSTVIGGSRTGTGLLNRIAIKIIVDTNIVFSAMLNSSGKIGKLLAEEHPHFSFYSCNFLKLELLKHRDKLLKATKLSIYELDELEMLVTANITFISEEIIPVEYFLLAEDMLADIDIKDVPFTALTEYVEGLLWTGDKKLIEGLKSKGYKQTITTSQLAELFDGAE